ncbi:MAG: hypothetical protein K2L64_01735 [Ureaplasma sp.]|nr:hypothetical protein [Ureaplasma sp.]
MKYQMINNINTKRNYFKCMSTSIKWNVFYAFNKCNSITSIMIPKLVAKILEYDFRNAPSNCVMCVKSGWDI